MAERTEVQNQSLVQEKKLNFDFLQTTKYMNFMQPFIQISS